MAKTTQGVEINSATYRGTTYSQLVGVTVTDNEITLEFVYVNPREKTHGEVVSRVTLPRQAGEGLAKIIPQTIAEHEANKRRN